MGLALKGKNTTYCADYKNNAHGEKRGIGLWTNNGMQGDTNDIAYLWQDEDKDTLIIDFDEIKKQNIHIAFKSHGVISDIVNFKAQIVKRKEKN